EQRPVADFVEEGLVELSLDENTELDADRHEWKQHERSREIREIELTEVCVRNELRKVGDEEEPHRGPDIESALKPLGQQIGHQRWRSRVSDEARDPGEARPDDAAGPRRFRRRPMPGPPEQVVQRERDSYRTDHDAD